MGALPRPADMFGDATSSVEIAERFESYKDELGKSFGDPRPVPGSPQMEGAGRGLASLQKSLGSAEVTKALSPELLESVRGALAQSDLNKDWLAGNGTTGGSPVATGLVAFDLEAPAKLLAPRPTPLRNRIARRQGIGLAHRFKVISGFTGSGTGGVGNVHPGITEGGVNAQGTGTQPGGSPFPTFLRGAKISYAGYDMAVPYKQFSLSDTVSWEAQYSSQGYEDVRQLSQTTLLYSSMLMEERMLLGGRGTDAGFSGALVPTVSLVPRAAVSPEVAITGATTNIYARVVGYTTWGTSVLTAAASVAVGSGVVDVNITNAATSGGLSYDIYVGTGASAPAASATWLAGTTNGNKFTIQGALPTSGTAATAAAAATDTTAVASGYDGILAYCTGPSAGSVTELNGKLSTTNPGDEFNQVFANLYDSVKADPDEILANGHDRKQLSDTLKAASGNSYRITVDNAGQAHNAQIGSLVTGVQNEVTGKMVDVTVHPWLAQGVMPVLSWTLPLPDSQVSDVFAVYNVQDYMGIQWPVNQFLYESSSYWFGTFICYAPAWNGAVIGITKV
jgi:hypothetical protein